jgi:uncharacterized protein YdaU (DUF1376 family)
MAEFPALPLWTDAYLADTGDLSLREHGVYLLMMMLAWRRPDCALPNDMAWLKRALGGVSADVHGNTFNAVVPGLLARFWELGNDGHLHQKRLAKEREFLVIRSAKQSERAKKRWSQSNENNAMPDATANGVAYAPTPTPTPTPTIKKEELRSSKESLPEGFDLFWAAYPRHVAKLKAVKAYKAAIEIAAPAEIIAGVRAFKFSRDPDYQPHPATWLNQRRWQDEESQSDRPTFVHGAI